MKYEIRLSAPLGEIVPLVAVASAKAHFRATAGGTDFHKPAYDGSFTRFADDLLREATCGRLKVCDQWGVPGESDALIADAKQTGDLMEVRRYVIEPDWERLRRENEPIAPGVWNLAHLDLGPSEVDWTRTHLSALCTTQNWLNEWGASRGDEFIVTHEGVEWADERGIHRPKRAAAATEASAAGKPDQPDPQRRLTALQALGGKATLLHGKWTFTKINALTAREKGRPRSDQKTIRRDLIEAAEAEHREGQKPTRPSMFPT